MPPDLADPWPEDDGSTPFTLAALHVYPVKACAGRTVQEVQLDTQGLAGDRRWMVVDAAGRFVTQRDLPRLVHVQAEPVGEGGLLLHAPGMPPLHVPLPDASSPTRPAVVWRDTVASREAGPAAQAWLSQFLGRPITLVHWADAAPRLSSRQWTGDIEAPNAYSDGYPILVLGEGSMAELNRRLAVRGHHAVEALRFRPNIVLAGLDAHAEDSFDELHIATDDGPVVLRLVKPCSRCPVPNIDLLTATAGTEPGDTLSTYRADPRLDGAITFGMNAVIVQGVGRALRVGQSGVGTVRF